MLPTSCRKHPHAQSPLPQLIPTGTQRGAAPTPNPQTIQLQLSAENSCRRGSIRTRAPLPQPHRLPPSSSGQPGHKPCPKTAPDTSREPRPRPGSPGTAEPRLPRGAQLQPPPLLAAPSLATAAPCPGPAPPVPTFCCLRSFFPSSAPTCLLVGAAGTGDAGWMLALLFFFFIGKNLGLVSPALALREAAVQGGRGREA